MSAGVCALLAEKGHGLDAVRYHIEFNCPGGLAKNLTCKLDIPGAVFDQEHVHWHDVFRNIHFKLTIWSAGKLKRRAFTGLHADMRAALDRTIFNLVESNHLLRCHVVSPAGRRFLSGEGFRPDRINRAPAPLWAYTRATNSYNFYLWV